MSDRKIGRNVRSVSARLLGRGTLCASLALIAACAGTDGGEGNGISTAPVSRTTPFEGDRFGVVTGGIYQAGAHRLDTYGDSVFSEMKNGLNVGWIRMEAEWGGAPPVGLPNVLLGQMIEKAHAHGLKVVVVLQPQLGGGPPGDADIAVYLATLDGVLNGAFGSNAAHPDALEVGNELNGTVWDPSMMAWLTRRVKEHLLDGGRWSDIQVVSAGTANTYSRDEGWYHDFFTSNAFHCDGPAPRLYGCTPGAPFMPFDFMAVHPYDGGKVLNACVNAETTACFEDWKQWVRADLADIRTKLQVATGKWTELMLTEFGWQSPPGGWHTNCPDDMTTFHNCVRTPDQMRAAMQASYEAFHDANGAWSVNAAIWYDAMDDAEISEDGGASGKHFGTREIGGAVKDDVWQKLRGLTGQPSRGDSEQFWGGHRFLDVTPGHWAFTYVETLGADGVIGGSADGSFAPDLPPTRGEFATALGHAVSYGNVRDSHYGTRTLSSPGTATFSDVTTRDPRFQYIETLAAAGIIGGYPDHTFRPDNTLTRGQASKMFVLAMGWTVEDPTQPHFSDVPPGSTFYTYIETSRSHGMITGYPDGTFHPNAQLTRGQMAKILYVNSR